MNELMGVDASFDELTPAIAAALWADGKRVFAQCLWTGLLTPVHASANLAVAKAQGFITIGYIALTSAFSGPWHVARARENIDPAAWTDLVLRPIDVELGGIDNGQIAAALLETGGRPCVYSSPRCWREDQGDTQQFSAAGVLLWLAQYDGIAYRGNADLPGGWNYGQLVGKQYTGGQDIDGINADSDVWDGDLLEGRMKWTDDKLDEALGNILGTLSTKADDAKVDDLANAIDVLPATKSGLRFLWALAAKAWPFGT